MSASTKRIFSGHRRSVSGSKGISGYKGRSITDVLTKVFCNLNGGIECLKKSLFFEWKNTGRYDIVVQMIKMNLSSILLCDVTIKGTCVFGKGDSFIPKNFII
jgi:hypothetical protein